MRPVQPEVVAEVLLALEAAPLYRVTAFAMRDLTALAFVGVRVPGAMVRLSPAEARLAADALVADQAYVGCLIDAETLRDAAREADRLVLIRASGRA